MRDSENADSDSSSSPVRFPGGFLLRHLQPIQSEYKTQHQPALGPNELLSLYSP